MTSDAQLKQWLLANGRPSAMGVRMLTAVAAEYGGYGARYTATAVELSDEDFETFKHCTNAPDRLLGMYLLEADVLFAPVSGAISEDLFFHEGVHACTPKEVWQWFFGQEGILHWNHRGRVLLEALTEFLTEEAGYDEAPRDYDLSVDVLYEAGVTKDLAARALFGGEIGPLRNHLADQWGLGPAPRYGFDPICQAFLERRDAAATTRTSSIKPHPWNGIRVIPNQTGS